MKDPGTIGAAAGGALLSVGAGQVVFGLQADALAYGFFGGVVAVWAFPTKRADGLSGARLYLTLVMTVLASVLSAAALGPISAAILHVQHVAIELELRAYSFLWGLGAQAGLLITAVEALRRRMRQLGGGGTTQ